MGEYLYIVIFIALGLLVPAGAIVTERFLAPFRPNSVKKTSYECGIETEGDSQVQFNVRYYLYALVFLIFDVEAIFLFPWAVHFRALGFFGFVEILIFVAILLVGFGYAWKKRALEWR